MDVYTNPQPDKYMLNKPFILPANGKQVIAYGKDQRSLILAVYAILIYFIFAFIWQLGSGVVVGILPANSRFKIIGLVAFWNSPDALFAMFAMSSYMKGLYFSRPRQNHPVQDDQEQEMKLSARPTPGDFKRGASLLMLSATFAALSFYLSIAYPGWLEVQDHSVAPVQPHAVKLPMMSINNHNDAQLLAAILRSSVMRALGSAEATEYISERSSYSYEYIPASEEIRYSYSADATDFGLQTHLDFKQHVQGHCVTEYDWLQSAGKEVDTYHLWGDSNSPTNYPTRGERYPQVPQLQLAPFPETDGFWGKTNSSYALILDSACVASSTASTDPWYKTQPMSDIPASIVPKYKELQAEYRVKPGRPALSCTQQTQYCLRGGCHSLEELCANDTTTMLPLGLCGIITFNFIAPKVYTLALHGSAFGLRSYVGSAQGKKIDANHASLKNDMERLVLAAFLSTKEAFRDAALMQFDSEITNLLLDPQGKHYPGSSSFVLRTRDVVTFRYDLLILAPVLLAGLVLVVLILEILKRSGHHSRFQKRQQALSATQLFRMLDEKESTDNQWNREFSMVPMPTFESVDRMQPIVNVENDGGRPQIEYAIVSDERGRRPLETSHSTRALLDETRDENIGASGVEMSVIDSRPEATQTVSRPDRSWQVTRKPLQSDPSSSRSRPLG